MRLYSTRIQHISNPLHVYCRLIDLGINSKISRKLGILYERYIYQYLLKDTRDIWTSVKKESL